LLPESLWHEIRNVDDFIGIHLFDLWTCNRDARQVVFWKYSREKKYIATFIDNGHCFGGPEWKFAPLVFPRSDWMMPHGKEWQRWADKIATFSVARLEIESVLIPPEWRGGNNKFAIIFEQLKSRQALIVAELRRGLSKFAPDRLKHDG
jgi:hypothetical protein